MLRPTFAGSFKKDRALAKRRGMDMDKLNKIMELIINEQPLPAQYRSHPLHGEWEGSMDCHIQGDWVLIYNLDPVKKEVYFQRTGTHADLEW